MVSPGATLATVAPLIEGLKDLYSTYSLRVDVHNIGTSVAALLYVNSMEYLKASEGSWLTEKLPLDWDSDEGSVLVGRICAETVSEQCCFCIVLLFDRVCQLSLRLCPIGQEYRC